jgi:hypothetical protein
MYIAGIEFGRARMKMTTKAVAVIGLFTMSGHAAAQDGTIFLECTHADGSGFVVRIDRENWWEWDPSSSTFGPFYGSPPCGSDNGAVRVDCSATEDVFTLNRHSRDRTTTYVINRRTGMFEFVFSWPEGGARRFTGGCSATEDPRPPARF